MLKKILYSFLFFAFFLSLSVWSLEDYFLNIFDDTEDEIVGFEPIARFSDEPSVSEPYKKLASYISYDAFRIVRYVPSDNFIYAEQSSFSPYLSDITGRLMEDLPCTSCEETGNLLAHTETLNTYYTIDRKFLNDDVEIRQADYDYIEDNTISYMGIEYNPYEGYVESVKWDDEWKHGYLETFDPEPAGDQGYLFSDEAAEGARYMTIPEGAATLGYLENTNYKSSGYEDYLASNKSDDRELSYLEAYDYDGEALGYMQEVSALEPDLPDGYLENAPYPIDLEPSTGYLKDYYLGSDLGYLENSDYDVSSSGYLENQEQTQEYYFGGVGYLENQTVYSTDSLNKVGYL